MLVLLVLLPSTTSSSWPTGQDECPCIDPFALGLLLNNNTPRATIAGCDIEKSGDRTCFSSAYGSTGCAAYDDDGLDPSCEYCASKWCYVDANNCARQNEESSYFKSAMMPLAQQELSSGASDQGASCVPTTRLSFSYQTCGFLDTYSSSTSGAAAFLRTFTSTLPGGALRVAFPGDSSSKYTLVSSKSSYPVGEQPMSGQIKVAPGEGVQGTNTSGAVVVFLAELFARMGVPWVEVPISQRSRDFSSSSSFTACVHDVAIGHVDMCWGNFWPTSVRAKMASFSSTMYNDQFFVVVPLQAGEFTIWDSIAKPFNPFSLDLWVVILVVFGLVGVNLTIENHEGKINWFDFVCSGLPTALLKGLNAYNLGEVPDTPMRTSGSWMTALFVGFTFQVLVTGYTAVVTTTLMSKGATEIRTLREGIERGFTFCANSDMVPGLVAQYPDLALLLVDSPHGGSLAAMDRGVCYGAIVHEDYWRAARLFNEPTARATCLTKARLAETITVVANAIPLRPEIDRVVSSMLTRDVEAGLFVAKRNEALVNYTYSVCAEADTTTVLKQFSLGELGGPMVFLVITSFLSMIVTRIGREAQRRTDALKREIDKDGDGVVTRTELVNAMASRVSRRLSDKMGDASTTDARNPNDSEI